jgi:hypothetical protein
MATTVTDPYSILAGAIEQVVRYEFDDEQFLDFRHDRLHASVGADGRTYVAVFPTAEDTRGIEHRLSATIQFYDGYKADVDPFQQVDPRIITNKAARLRQALAKARVTGMPQVWFFDVDATRYVPDATGNISRFEMVVSTRGNNDALVETA